MFYIIFVIVWLMVSPVLAVFASNHLISSDHTHQFSRELVNNFSNNQCHPQLSEYPCNYFYFYGAKYFGNTAYLRAGFCATYNEHTKLVAFSVCPFFQSNDNYYMDYEDGVWYIPLPDNISKLNDFMCEPLNRKGRVCSECKDGFGPALVSYGFQIQCSNCTDSGWYGILLYMFLEIVPVTVFYFAVILIFQINITSAPMTCYIMYSQFIPLWWNFSFSGEDIHVSRKMFILNNQSEFVRKLIYALYDLWNLRFFYFLMPPFCISSKIKPLHFALLGYFSIFYPMVLILLTWLLIKLHDHNFKPLVWLWRLTHRCFTRLRRKWSKTSDIIDVFSTFFLLSFSKVLYQTVIFFTYQTIWFHCCDTSSSEQFVTNIDLNVEYGSREHLLFGIPALLLCCVFNIFPSMVLTLYPFRLFRKFLSKCRLDGLVLNTFVEKFYGCYRNGLDGGRDMRSFAGLYFILRPLPFFAGAVVSIPILKISNNDPYFPRSIVFITTSLMIALCRPYNKMYMNVLDSLLLAHLAILCHLISSYPGFQHRDNFVYTASAMMALPFTCFMLFFIYRAFKKIVKSSGFERFLRKCKVFFLTKIRVTHSSLSTHTDPVIEQPLIDSTCANYGTIK